MPGERAASRTQTIETLCVFSWDLSGELWTFRAGAQLLVGPVTDLDASPQTVTSAVAADMIRAGRAEAVCVRELEPDQEMICDLELVQGGAEEAA